MAELKSVALSSLKPNPHRDLDEFPLIPEKLEKLKESIGAEGFWEGVIARPAAKGGYEIAFGHHRVAAAREVLGESAKVPIIVRDLDDTQMLRWMMRENAEEHGWDFYNTDVQCVRAAVLQLRNGKERPAEWPMPATGERARTDQLRDASAKNPFGRRVAEVSDSARLYTALDLAQFLKRTKKNKGTAQGVEAQPEVVTALDALASVAGGLRPRVLRGLNRAEAREVIRGAQEAADEARRAAEKAAAEAEQKAEQKRVDAERRREAAEREYQAKVRREGEEKARREREALEKAQREAAEAAERRKREEREAKAKAESDALEARAKAAEATVKRLRGSEDEEKTTAAELRAERQMSKTRTAPGAKPKVAVDLTPRQTRVLEQLKRITLPLDLEPLLALAYDTTHCFDRRCAKQISDELNRLASALKARRRELNLVAKRHGWKKEDR